MIPDGVEKVYKDGLYLYEDGLAKGTGTVIVGEDRVKFFLMRALYADFLSYIIW